MRLLSCEEESGELTPTSRKPTVISLCRFEVIATLLSLPSANTSAHRASGAEFDPNRPIILRGPVVKVGWVNPHAWIHLEVSNEDDSTTSWMVKGGTPNTLLRRGLNKWSLPPGIEIVVDDYQSMVAISRSQTAARYLCVLPELVCSRTAETRKRTRNEILFRSIGIWSCRLQKVGIFPATLQTRW